MTDNQLRGTLIRQQAPSPLYVRTGQAQEHYRKTCIAFSNQEATMADLVEAAEKLRSLQSQKNS